MKLSTKAAVFKRVSLLIRGEASIDWGTRPPKPPLALALTPDVSKSRLVVTCLELYGAILSRTGPRETIKVRISEF